uniref:MaoC-like domain-containing protein n=1 Tax=Ananas comosus var. bracteatus TaxID=296719 RepID=A0A6V7QLG1_ANACO|nr:unnamed protein product [Ananas comosus var. bracteatus]
MRLARLIGTLSPRHPPPRPLPFSTTSSSSSSVASDAPARVLGVGGVLRGEPRRFSGADVAAYAAVSGDRNPLHLDAEFARGVAGFERGSVVHGMLVASLFPSLIASHFVRFPSLFSEFRRTGGGRMSCVCSYESGELGLFREGRYQYFGLSLSHRLPLRSILRPIS